MIDDKIVIPCDKILNKLYSYWLLTKKELIVTIDFAVLIERNHWKKLVLEYKFQV